MSRKPRLQHADGVTPPKPPRTFEQVIAGEWVSPRRAGYFMKCCDCGLVHWLRFRLVKNRYGCGRKIQFQVFRR